MVFFIHFNAIIKRIIPGTDLLFQGSGPSIISANELDFRVRDGNGYGLIARSTGNYAFYYTNSPNLSSVVLTKEEGR